jgi:hypothetical protein
LQLLQKKRLAQFLAAPAGATVRTLNAQPAVVQVAVTMQQRLGQLFRDLPVTHPSDARLSPLELPDLGITPHRQARQFIGPPIRLTVKADGCAAMALGFQVGFTICRGC